MVQGSGNNYRQTYLPQFKSKCLLANDIIFLVVTLSQFTRTGLIMRVTRFSFSLGDFLVYPLFFQRAF